MVICENNLGGQIHFLSSPGGAVPLAQNNFVKYQLKKSQEVSTTW